MKKIGLFHSIPKLRHLQRSYMYFDELQTSSNFLRTTYRPYNGFSANPQFGPYNVLQLLYLEELYEKEIISPKEDIERRIIPSIGPFDKDTINSKLKQLSNLDDDQSKALIVYFNTLKRIREALNFEIYVEGAGSFQIKKKIKELSNFEIPEEVERTISNLILTAGGLTNESGKVIRDERNITQDKIYRINNASEIYSRAAAALLNKYYVDNDYVPIVGNFSYNNNVINATSNKRRDSIYNLVIQKFPIPDSGVEWEKLIEFKNDSSSNRKLLNLRIWVEELASSDMSLATINDSLKTIIYEYEEHLKIHKIKYSMTTFESIVIPIIESAENLVRLKFSDSLKSLLSIRKSNVPMLEDEVLLKGKQAAYIVDMEHSIK